MEKLPWQEEQPYNIDLTDEERARILQCVEGRAEYIEMVLERERLDARLRFYRWLYERNILSEEL